MKKYSNSKNLEVSPEVEGFNLKRFLSKYIKYWPYVFLSVILSLAGAYVKNLYNHPVYKIESKFLIKDYENILDILDLTGQGGRVVNNQTQKLANETIMFKSKPLAEQVLNRLDFDVEYYEEGKYIKREIYEDRPVIVELDWGHEQLVNGFVKVTWENDEFYTVDLVDESYSLALPDKSKNQALERPVLPNKRYAFGEWTESNLFKFKIELDSLHLEKEVYLKFRDKNSLTSQYSGEDLQVWPVDGSSSILGLSLITGQPEKGQLYLNTLMEIFLDNELKNKTRIASNTVDFIDSQISGVADSLYFTGNDLQNYRANNKTYNIGTEGNTIFSQLSELDRTIAQERFKKEYYNNLQEYLVREDYQEIVMPSGSGIDDPILNSLIENLIVLQSEKSRHMSTQTEASPTVREVNRKISDLNASIKEVLKNVSQNADFTIEDLERQKKKLEFEFSRLPTTEQNLLRFQRKFDLNENIYTFLLQRRAESAIAMASNTVSNKIVEYAGLNYQPINVRETSTYILALAFGFIFPISIIGVFTLLDRRIKDPMELEEDLMVPLLGKIAKNKTNTSLAVFTEPRSAIAETFRSLKTNIGFVLPPEKKITLAITSTVSGEGKTFTAINLGAIYSLNQKKTVLISCDMFKDDSFKDFQLKHKRGLSNYLCKQIENVEDIIQPTIFPFFDIIVAGITPPNPSELLGSDRFGILLEDLKKIYDVIVIDTPPVGLISQSFEVLRNVDIILFVLRYNYSDKSFVKIINSIKINKRVKNVYAMLNGVADKNMTYNGYENAYYKVSKPRTGFLKGIFTRNKAAF